MRKVAKVIDFGFVSAEVEQLYGYNGNVSVPPPVILKLLALLMLYNVRSEREMMDTLPERLDWLWFLGYDLDSEIPHHIVLSKARRRWGAKQFETFFERIVYQCVEAGLVEGKKIFVDAGLVGPILEERVSALSFFFSSFYQNKIGLPDHCPGINIRVLRKLNSLMFEQQPGKIRP